ncbi:MAG: hydroxyacid dehydrogenase [Myxococcota bacterium]
MTFRVLVADALDEEGLKIFRQSSSVELEVKVGMKPAELCEILPRFDGLVVRSATQVDAKVIAAGSKLQIIGRAGIGVDNIDVPAATRAGIVVMNTPDANATTTAEHALALIFAMARQVPQADASMKAGKWDKKRFVGRELRGLTLGVVGAGNIGRLVAERAQALKMRVVVHDPYIKPEAAKQAGWQLMDLDALLATSDILTVHTPLNDHTRGLINAKSVSKMKKGIMVVNCARGGIYDEQALLAGLEEGTIAAAALDVFVKEPPAADDPLVRHPNVICTPHLGASTREAQVLVSPAIAEQMVAYAKDRTVRNAVNTPKPR